MAYAATCFHEADPGVPLFRRSAAEGLGTLLLVFAASAGGIAASRAFAATPGMVLPTLAFVLAGALVSLIVALGSVSGGHFNPLITGLQYVSGERSLPCTVSYVVAQLVGGTAGGLIAAKLWGQTWSSTGGAGWGGFPSEAIASAGLMVIVFGCSRSGKASTGPFAVGAWLASAVVAMPTTSYANPAVVLGALVTSGPVALGPDAAFPYVLAEVVGALTALAVVALLFPRLKDA